MTTFAATMTVASDPPLTGDQVVDIIESLVDELDRLGTEPEVTTRGQGSSFDLSVEFRLDPEGLDEVETFAEGLGTLRSALHAAGIGTPGMVAKDFAPSLSRDAEPV